MATIELETPDKLEYIFNPISSGSLVFKVRCPNDAHIALTCGPEESDPMYEVFIGGWGNTKSVIRRNRSTEYKAEANTPGILNGSEFRAFWIKWNGGHVSVYREGEDDPFLTYIDPEPFGIGYFGVLTAWGSSGTWKIEGYGEVITPDALEYKYKPVVSGGLEINIKAPHNCHVALTGAGTETDPMYEVILGGWENTASVIRCCRVKPDKVRGDTPALLAESEYRRFYIEWHAGYICVRTETRDGPVILAWKDETPFGVSHFGVRTAWGATGKWRVRSYDARVPGQGGGSAPSAPVISGSGSQCWVPASDGQIPPSAVEGGSDNGEPLYVARAQHEGALIPGKLVSSHGCAYIAWGGAEHPKAEYEVLCDCPSQWVPASGGEIPPGAVAGGETEDGEPLFVGRVEHNGALTTGKLQASHNVLYIPYGGEEMGFPDYEVLVSL